MTPQEIAAIISVARRAPLANMAEAQAVDQLLRKLAMHFAPAAPPNPDTTDTAHNAERGA